ncbi:MAG: hypothetical protein AAF211_04745 [Myxococcota bacterium]
MLTIDGESRNESRANARWLDERFPERPLFPQDDVHRVEILDEWIQHCFIASRFKFAMPQLSRFLPVQLVNAWRLGRIMDRTIPGGAIGWRRLFWPLVLRQAPFIRREAARAPGGSLVDTAKAVARRIHDELRDGPFLGGRPSPSVADLSVYANIVPGFELGLAGGGAMLEAPVVRAWAERVHVELDPTLPLVPDSVRKRSFSAEPGGVARSAS